MKRLLIGVSAVLICAWTAYAAPIVAVDIGDDGGSMSGAGVLAPVGSTWNVIAGTSGSGLLDTEGKATGVGFVGDGFSTGDNVAGTVNDLIDDSRVGQNPTGVTSPGGVSRFFALTITGLTVAEKHDLVLYGAQNFGHGRGTVWTVYSGATYGPTVSMGTSDASDFTNGGFVENSTYIRLQVCTDENGSLRIFGDNEDTDPRYINTAFLNGFEIQQVPEPTALGLGALGLLLLRRRRR